MLYLAANAPEALVTRSYYGAPRARGGPHPNLLGSDLDPVFVPPGKRPCPRTLRLHPADNDYGPASYLLLLRKRPPRPPTFTPTSVGSDLGPPSLPDEGSPQSMPLGNGRVGAQAGLPAQGRKKMSGKLLKKGKLRAVNTVHWLPVPGWRED
ncbi:unnamed protein product [Rangifer tarandus platyrhynchus]|uniref:Uncharacterized protein n=2 Tax=Rangifer tarandus platyrhynchus TaxID=3082113 RepID=A0ACB0FJY9_RANTA|nr:unnamed protein product [Rangifer tarandus platyrhynchus]CAI9713083.1 unnamed protein product [Rangifer tarandus platyrhynchus]